MAALSYVIRPKVYCARCGGCCEQMLHPNDVSLRTLTCMQQDCVQFNKPVAIRDPSIVIFEQASDVIQDEHGGH